MCKNQLLTHISRGANQQEMALFSQRCTRGSTSSIGCHNLHILAHNAAPNKVQGLTYLRLRQKKANLIRQEQHQHLQKELYSMSNISAPISHDDVCTTRFGIKQMIHSFIWSMLKISGSLQTLKNKTPCVWILMALAYPRPVIESCKAARQLKLT